MPLITVRSEGRISAPCRGYMPGEPSGTNRSAAEIASHDPSETGPEANCLRCSPKGSIRRDRAKLLRQFRRIPPLRTVTEPQKRVPSSDISEPSGDPRVLTMGQSSSVVESGTVNRSAASFPHLLLRRARRDRRGLHSPPTAERDASPRQFLKPRIARTTPGPGERAVA